MAKKSKSVVTEEVTKVEVKVTDLKVGDEIYLNEEDNNKYLVLDVGNPFILIEGKDHFANLYRVVKTIYKSIV